VGRDPSPMAEALSAADRSSLAAEQGCTSASSPTATWTRRWAP
jgi:hypothetical protein